MNVLKSIFMPAEKALSEEMVRNESARLQLSSARLQRKMEETNFNSEVKKMDESLRVKQENFATSAKPMLDEFNSVSLAQHYYQEVLNTVASQSHLVSQIAEREFGQYGYISKKLVSFSLHFEVLKRRMTAGEPFNRELSRVLHDADSEDLNLVAAPLKQVDTIPSQAAARATAFDLAQAIMESGKAPAQEPVRGWLDLLKFRTSRNPVTLQQREASARRAAEALISYVKQGELHQALRHAEAVYGEMQHLGLANSLLLDNALVAFKEAVLPNIAADMLLRYSRASLNACRYACVEKMLSE
ncbi:hypothetical protein TRVL_00060 [Trypanosoma vivax]|uniref:Uncharacterized protein n=1 Tax=Trypanosoma vivax (strain Y486) TaxID=1055687 RepID=G0TTT8_TRYVY|nr:hypothetical protein TRVL_00060 [Trypanosoma vivax]CCC47370.1 conserved hypothetical protein [Trypanosoma vivax Y486]